MKAAFPLRLRRHRTSGLVLVAIQTQRGRQWVSTGQTTRERAKEVCDAAMIERLQMAACAETLTADAISRFVSGRRFTCADILEAWGEEAAPDLAPDTFNAYRTTLAQWMEHAECASQPLSAVKRTRLEAFVNEQDVAIGTRRSRLAALRSFYRFASSAGYCIGNMAERVRVKKRDLLLEMLESKETIPVTEAEYRLLMDSPQLTGFWRWATALGWNLGLRLRDVACLEWASIRGDRIVVHTKKTGQRVSLPVDDPLLGGGELRRIFLEMVESSHADSAFCFPAMRDKALDPKRRAGLSTGFRRVLHAHGIHGKRFHGLRHAFGVRLDAADKTLEQIGELLGHSSTETTKLYTDHS